MSKALLTPRWFWRAWPFIVTVALIAVHYSLTRAFDPPDVHRIVSFVLQLVGVGFVLYSIDQNLGMFRHQSMWSLPVRWLKSFPPALKPITGRLSATSDACVLNATGTLRHTKKCTTLDERVGELERQLKECTSLVHQTKRELSQKCRRHGMSRS